MLGGKVDWEKHTTVQSRLKKQSSPKSGNVRWGEEAASNPAKERTMAFVPTREQLKIRYHIAVITNEAWYSKECEGYQ